MLQLSGVPVLVRDQSEFSQLMRAWLNKVRSSPAPELAEVQRQHDDRQASEASREQANWISLEAAQQAQYRKDINTLARAAEARQGPEKPPVEWVTRKVVVTKLGPFYRGIHTFLGDMSKRPEEVSVQFARKSGTTWWYDLDALAQYLVRKGKMPKMPDFDAAPEKAAKVALVASRTTRHVCK